MQRNRERRSQRKTMNMNVKHIKLQDRVEVYMSEHLLLLFDPLGPLTESATLAASANASLTPRFFIAEHSATRQLPFKLLLTSLRKSTHQDILMLVSFWRLPTLVCNRSSPFPFVRSHSPPSLPHLPRGPPANRISAPPVRALRLDNSQRSPPPIWILRFRVSLLSRPSPRIS